MARRAKAEARADRAAAQARNKLPFGAVVGDCPRCLYASLVCEGFREGKLSPWREYQYACVACGMTMDVAAKPGETPGETLTRSFAAYGIGKAVIPAAPAPPEPECPVINGSLIGYRAWSIATWRLSGAAQMWPWSPGVNEAKCAGYKLDSHQAPDEHCQCGIYALARFRDGAGWWDAEHVRGAIEAWSDEGENRGRFFLQGAGFRAQFARVVLLAVDPDWPRAKRAAVRALASEHDADVCKLAHLEAAATEHGQLVPEELIDRTAITIRSFGRVVIPQSFPRQAYGLP